MEHRTPRRVENGVELVEIRLRSLNQLFNSLDPSPFRERDLDREAASYIVEEFEEIGYDRQAKLVVHLPAEELVQAGAVPDALHQHFRWSAHASRRDLRRLLRLGRSSLLVGLLAASGLVGASQAAASLVRDTLSAPFLESITIVAWVILWRPVELLLYDWWPIRARVKLYDRLAIVEVECKALAIKSS